MPLKLTDRQRWALEFLRDDEEYGDLVYEPRAGWWLGADRTNGKLAFGLIRLCLITKEPGTSDNICERWGINESGRRALDGKPPYRNGSGVYTDKICQIGEKMKIDEFIEQALEQGETEVAAVLSFVRDKGAAATIMLLAAADRHANARALRRVLRTADPLAKAVNGIKDELGAKEDRPWLDLADRGSVPPA